MLDRLARYHRDTGAGHYHSSASVLPILIDIKARMRKGDVCILSKAHAVSAYELVFQGDLPDVALVQGEFGSLGVGLSFALGVSYMRPTHTVFVVCGDGEMQSGAAWEAMLLMERLGMKTRNIEIHVDANGMQGMGDCPPPRIPHGRMFYHRTHKGTDWKCHYRGPDA